MLTATASAAATSSTSWFGRIPTSTPIQQSNPQTNQAAAAPGWMRAVTSLTHWQAKSKPKAKLWTNCKTSDQPFKTLSSKTSLSRHQRYRVPPATRFRFRRHQPSRPITDYQYPDDHFGCHQPSWRRYPKRRHPASSNGRTTALTAPFPCKICCNTAICRKPPPQPWRHRLRS